MWGHGSARPCTRSQPCIHPSSAPDTMCSSLMSWMQSIEPLQKKNNKKNHKQTSDHDHTLWFYETDTCTHSPAMSPTTCRLPVMLSTRRGVAGATSTSPPPPTPDLLMPIEDELRLLWDLPDPHSAIPSPRGHTALPAQAVQPCDDVLVPKAGGEHSEL